MATIAQEGQSSEISTAVSQKNLRLLDWLTIITSFWLIAGLFTDGWAHNHIPTLESFFTPWHGVLYSGFMAVALVHLGAWLISYMRKQPIPDGYKLGLWGVLIFAIGGVGDSIWHELFGIEANVDALLSPTHLILAIGMVLMVGSPFRAAWRLRSSKPGFVAFLPVILSITFMFSAISFMAQFTHPFQDAWASNNFHPAPGVASNEYVLPDPWVSFHYAMSNSDIIQIAGISGILLQTAILLTVVFLLARRWKLPFGTFTILFTLNIVAQSFLEDQFWLIIAAFLGGLSADLLYLFLKPSRKNVVAFRIFAYLTPALLYIYYFAVLFLTSGIWWTIHFWMGAIVIVGIEGLLLSYLLLPPQFTEPAEA